MTSFWVWESFTLSLAWFQLRLCKSFVGLAFGFRELFASFRTSKLADFNELFRTFETIQNWPKLCEFSDCFREFLDLEIGFWSFPETGQFCIVQLTWKNLSFSGPYFQSHASTIGIKVINLLPWTSKSNRKT